MKKKSILTLILIFSSLFSKELEERLLLYRRGRKRPLGPIVA